MKYFTQFAIGLLCLGAMGSVQAYTIEGNVTCKGDSSPLAGIEVTATQGATALSATTSTAGSYSMQHGPGVWDMNVVTPHDFTGPATAEGTFISGVDFVVDDPACRIPACGDGYLDEGEQCDDGNLADGDGCSAMCTIEQCGNGILDEGEQCDDGNLLNGDGCSATCEIETGGEGCTPGYWRQTHHFDSYPDAYPPETLFVDVFGRDAFPGQTLAQVTRAKGGGINALGRHAVAAFLNAASDDVEYDRTPGSVVESFQYAYDMGMYEFIKNVFAHFNEQSCPLN